MDAKLFYTAFLLAAFHSTNLAAEVKECQLSSEGTESDISLVVYSYEGEVHSISLELTTDYGDTLPYLFFCGINCVMDMRGDDYRYTLNVSPSVTAPQKVTLTTKSKSDSFEASEEFLVNTCNDRH